MKYVNVKTVVTSSRLCLVLSLLEDLLAVEGLSMNYLATAHYLAV